MFKLRTTALESLPWLPRSRLCWTPAGCSPSVMYWTFVCEITDPRWTLIYLKAEAVFFVCSGIWEELMGHLFWLYSVRGTEDTNQTCWSLGSENHHSASCLAWWALSKYLWNEWRKREGKEEWKERWRESGKKWLSSKHSRYPVSLDLSWSWEADVNPRS